MALMIALYKYESNGDKDKKSKEILIKLDQL